jgi:two-component system response regulator
MKEKSVLIVEDNPDDLELILRALQRNGMTNQLEVARDGQEAIDWLNAVAQGDPGTLPALILLDIQLPKIDGPEVLRHIRTSEKLKRIPVVMLTTSDEERDKIKCYNLGVNSYIRKPVDFNQFSEITRQLGLYWLALNEPSHRK